MSYISKANVEKWGGREGDGEDGEVHPGIERSRETVRWIIFLGKIFIRGIINTTDKQMGNVGL